MNFQRYKSVQGNVGRDDGAYYARDVNAQETCNSAIHPGLFLRNSGTIILMVLVVKYRPEHRVVVKESLARMLNRSSVVWNVRVMYWKLLKLVKIPRPEMPEKR